MTAKASMTVGRSLALGVGLLIALTLFVSLLGAWGLRQSDAALHAIAEGSVKPLGQLGEIKYLVTRNRILIMDVAMHATPDVIAKRSKEYGENKAKTAALWSAYMAAPMNDQERALASNAEQARKALTEQGLDVVLAHEQAGRIEDGWRQIDVVSKLAPAFAQAMDKLTEQQVQSAEESFQASQASNDRLLLIAVVATLGALVAGVWIGVGMTRSLKRSLGAEPADLAAVAGRIAQGSLANDGSAPAPHGSVMASMQAMRTALVDLVGSVRTGVDNVSTASAEIAQGNADLSSRTEQQASSLQETAASMEQLTGTVRSSADTALQANQLAKGASAAAARGGDAVAKVVRTMSEIQSSSHRIADITSVIDGIAFQTNILALNAAVEAARAGEQGRGFAVVASEVRTLAQRSADAARQIKTLINDSVQKVQAGDALVQEAGTTMNDVVAQVQSVSSLMAEITGAAAEQRQGIEQVGNAVTLLDQTTQQNAALVEQSAAAAESLEQQARRLADAVSVFRL
ncbi:Methyl-accepting chemotaxis serine transducer [Rubrivivax sp. A210]|uniref:methyl-accepting chemotaxis protein n=1 Tax=Rubrivivax sp. A210 TaxID=2772301 RepID=UPI0019BF46F0|nr:methyl-accepting chemotaxis protein [Rubrivivax sp. A210]CAD5372434.1 Methyl-accepting chemotaxis serine transducer [Rubrivivax sp. A210]